MKIDTKRFFEVAGIDVNSSDTTKQLVETFVVPRDAGPLFDKDKPLPKPTVCPKCGKTPIFKTHKILGWNAEGHTVWGCSTGDKFNPAGGSEEVVKPA
jgi:hypothetical protein